MNRLAVWFDIPVADMDRAVKFYERVTGQKLKRMEVGEGKATALFESAYDEHARRLAKLYEGLGDAST